MGLRSKTERSEPAAPWTTLCFIQGPAHRSRSTKHRGMDEAGMGERPAARAPQRDGRWLESRAGEKGKEKDISSLLLDLEML